MKKLIFIFLIFFSCSSCSYENIKPNDLIPEETMVDILYDMSLISVSKGINKRILENNGIKPKKYILKKYNIDSLQFVVSNDYYSKDLERYLLIYETVLNKLETNRELIIDSIDKMKKARANRSIELLEKTPKNDLLSNPKPGKNINSKILKN